MASVNRIMRTGRAGFRIRFYLGGRQRELYVVGDSKKAEAQANKVAAHCDELAKAKANNVPPAPDSVAWANGTDGSIRESLIAWGLADPINPKLLQDDGRLLGPFVDAFIESRTDWAKNTILNYKQVRRLLCEYFGERKPMNSITPSDADKWRRWMASDKKLASTTISKHCKRAKTMLGEAVRDRLLSVSPFAGMKGGLEVNPDRQRFIDAATSKLVYDACPNADWRCIFVLGRFCGMRCPSEILNLKWTDIDWDAGKIRIEAAKTALRYCPLFPEVRNVLWDAHELAPDKSVYVVGGYRAGQNLGTQFERIIKAANVVPWPKLFVNLRSTRRTELQEKFPSHVVDAWMGHSTKIAERHYLQVTGEHWTAGSEFNSVPLVPLTGPLINDDSDTIANHHEMQETNETNGSEGSGCLPIDYSVPPTGIEPVTRL